MIKHEGSGNFETLTDEAPLDPTVRFNGITTTIPTGSFEDLTSPDKLQFSNRGSMLLDGKRAAMVTDTPASPRSPSVQSTSIQPSNDSRVSLATRQQRTLSADETELSQRVRSMYEFGNERGVDWSERTVLDDMVVEEHEEQEGQGQEEAEKPTPEAQPMLAVSRPQPVLRTPSFNKRESAIAWEPYEAAGGLEDWQDVGGDEVDRYGFILPKKAESKVSSTNPSTGLMRVSTALVEISESPRRKRTIRRSASNASKVRDGKLKHSRKLSRTSNGSLRPTASIYSARSTSSVSVHQSPLRMAANRLPHNKERRWMDEASDMLTLPPGLEEVAVAKEGGRAALAMKKKEWKREEKWRRMGKTSQAGQKGAGMLFDFDPRDPKVISRTWKGIPDR